MLHWYYGIVAAFGCIYIVLSMSASIGTFDSLGSFIENGRIVIPDSLTYLKGTMKYLLFCLPFFLANCITDTTQIDTSQNGVHSDTIQYIMQYDSVLSKTDTVALYAWEETDGDSIWLDTSRIKPDIIDTIYIPYAPVDYWEELQSSPNVRSYIPVDKNYSLYHNSVDTFFMPPIYENGMLVYEFDIIEVTLCISSVNLLIERPL